MLQHPNSAFHTRVFPFGKVTVLTNRELIDEMNRAPPDELSFDDVSRMVRHETLFSPRPVDSTCKQVIQPDHTVFGWAPVHHPVTVLQQNFTRRLNSLFPGMLDVIKKAVDSALEHISRGYIIACLLSSQS